MQRLLGKKNVSPFPALETVPVLPFVALAFDNNSFSSCLFLGCVTWLDSVMTAVGKKGMLCFKSINIFKRILFLFYMFGCEL